MTAVNTVLGPLDTADLGFTLTHEHIIGGDAGVSPQVFPEFYGDDFTARIISALTQAKEAGINTIIDATCGILSRDIKTLVETSRQSGVNIIASTGFFRYIPCPISFATVDIWAKIFIREIEEGIEGTDIKAGVIKAGSFAAGVTPEEEKILRGAAQAQLKTGAPIILHSDPAAQIGRQQLAILKDAGANPHRVKIDHCLDTRDLDYLKELLAEGCYLGMDPYPGRSVSPADRTKTMKALIDDGYAGRICPSHDFFIIKGGIDELPDLYEERIQMNTHGLLYIKEMVFPQLREMGVSEETINNLFIESPRNLFEGV